MAPATAGAWQIIAAAGRRRILNGCQSITRQRNFFRIVDLLESGEKFFASRDKLSHIARQQI
jgi:hypothetical protein